MVITQNQLFYAALFWLEALPGGEAFSASIADKYDMLYIPTGAPKMTGDDRLMPFGFDKKTLMEKVEQGITEDEAEIFFDLCYDALKRNPPEPQFDFCGQGSTYIEIGRSPAFDREHKAFLYSQAVELGLAASGLSRELLPITRTYLHDNGQIFACVQRDVKELNYPGRPKPDFKSCPTMTYDDIIATGKAQSFQFEIFYRVVPVETGKSYDIAHATIGGTVDAMSWHASEGDIMLVQGGDGLGAFSDAELIAKAKTEILGAQIVPRSDYAAGKTDSNYGFTIEATASENIVRYLSKPFLAIELTEKTQLFSGPSFCMAKPGDKIIAEGKGYSPRLISEDILERCATRMLPAEPPRNSAVPRKDRGPKS